MKSLAYIFLLGAMVHSTPAQSADVAPAINQFGLDLLRAGAASETPGNLLLSPYSLESALAMAWAGADGRTEEEMRRVLHLAGDQAAVIDGLGALARDLRELRAASRQRAESDAQRGVSWTPIELDVANRLFVQSGFTLKPDFTHVLREQFGAPLEELDFLGAAETARLTIDAWVVHETHDRIRDLIPSGALDANTRLVLANAVYLRAPWEDPFEREETRPEPFWVGGRTPADVPTMQQRKSYPYEQRDGFIALAVPYEEGGLQFLILLPDQRNGLAQLERTVSPALLAACARMPRRDVVLHLPKFKLAPPTMSLSSPLRGLGMATAFDQPRGGANFDRIAPRRPDLYLYLSDVFHRAWLSVDEDGTEAAAATEVALATFGVEAGRPVPPVEVRVDRPFLFAIQHVASGTCLFLGRVGDPRQ